MKKNPFMFIEKINNSNNEKLKSMIKFTFTPFDYGLQKTIRWYQNYLED